MVKLTTREAVKIYHVSRPTLTKAIKTGKISALKGGKGAWQIDQSELARVYRPRVNEITLDTPSNSDEFERLKGALNLAEARADAAEKLAQERAERIDDLRLLLPAPKSKGWWPW